MHLIINKEWLTSFIENNYTDEQVKSISLNFFLINYKVFLFFINSFNILVNALFSILDT